MSSIAVIIVNYKTPDLALDCLRSLEKVLPEASPCRAIVVDNASKDGSADAVAAAMAVNGWDKWASLVGAKENLGFAGGNNLGIDAANRAGIGGDYMVLLNSDTLMHAGAISHCVQVMEGEPRIGAMSCRVLNADGSIQNVTRRFPRPLRMTICAAGLPWKLPGIFGWANGNDVPTKLLETKRDCDWIGGAFMFIRAEALWQVGPLDEAFFFYGEDIEFCWRLHKAGWRVHYDPAASITHYGAGSSEPSKLPTTTRNQHCWRARYLVQRKCNGWLAEQWVRGVDRVALWLRRSKLALRGRRTSLEYENLSESLAVLRSKEIRA